MGQTAEELRGELATRRDALGQDLAAIGDRVSPGRIVERRRAAVGQSLTRARERVMGVADGATSAVGGAASSVGDAASSMTGAIAGAPDAIKEHTEGAPLAAGLMAFGAGFLVSALLPGTRTEQRVAAQLQPALESVAADVGSAGQAMVQELADEARDAADDLASTAQDAAQGIKEHAADVVQARADDAKVAVDDVTQAARP